MTRVHLYAPIADGVTVEVDRELDLLRFAIGKWTVELSGGKLRVRPLGAAINDGSDVLTVDA